MAFKVKNTAYYKKKFAESEKASPYNKSSFAAHEPGHEDPKIMAREMNVAADRSTKAPPPPPPRIDGPGPQDLRTPEEIKKEELLMPPGRNDADYYKKLNENRDPGMIEAGLMYDDEGFIVKDPELRRKSPKILGRKSPKEDYKY